MSEKNGVARPRIIIEKVWESHIVAEQPGAPALVYIDLHLVHEVTSPQAFAGLRERGLKVRRPDLSVATTDHSIPTHDRSLPIMDRIAATQIEQLEKNCRDFGITLFGPHSTSSVLSRVSRSRA
jgi:3-isopropylmalate/(R)-2-methylmalate dehydratase large subunit